MQAGAWWCAAWAAIVVAAVWLTVACLSWVGRWPPSAPDGHDGHGGVLLLHTAMRCCCRLGRRPCQRAIHFCTSCFTHAQMAATFHEMGPLEAQGSWLRFWCGGWVGVRDRWGCWYQLARHACICWALPESMVCARVAQRGMGARHRLVCGGLMSLRWLGFTSPACTAAAAAVLPARLDMGTADELALDVLINALSTFSK